MKKMKLLILIILFSLKAFAPSERVMYIPEGTVINPYEAIWEATCYIETRHNAYAIGDLNFKEGSYGIAQIRRSRLLDYYQQTGIWYNVTDMFSIEKSKEVWMYYASQYYPWQIDRIAREWNGGPRGMQKKSTIKYFKKVKEKL